MPSSLSARVGRRSAAPCWDQAQQHRYNRTKCAQVMSPLSCHVHASLFSMRRARWLATFWHRGSSNAVPLSSIGGRARSGREAPQQDDGAGQTSSVRVPRQPKPNKGETQIRPNAIDSTNLTTAQLYQTQGLINPAKFGRQATFCG